ncbi:MAG: hypothetical protein HON54_12625 [Verrucomicrobia bacterium]|nr:hypothetical protein [Verrucomicrobiota bacterium]
MQITRNSRKINLSAKNKKIALIEVCDKLKTEQPGLAKRRVLDPSPSRAGEVMKKPTGSLAIDIDSLSTKNPLQRWKH